MLFGLEHSQQLAKGALRRLPVKEIIVHLADEALIGHLF